MSLTGLPEPHPPIRTNPWFGDFITALHAMSATMAAYIHAQKTGEGQVVDVPQFEVIQRHMGPVESVYFKENKVLKRRGNRDVTVNTQPYDSYEALDGWIVISATERAEFDAVCRVMEQDPKRWAKAFDNPDSDVGREFDHTLRSWVNQRAAVEVVLLMNEAGVPCSKVMSAADIAEDPHYQARGVYQEWPAVDLGKKIKGMGAYPKVQEMPGKVWRGSAGIGYDNEQVYTSLVGLTKQQFEELRGKKII
jgi:crotonobetainyl-CoA:carnitine CoA-transferase CaiB-like acyl-CoA transferase